MPIGNSTGVKALLRRRRPCGLDPVVGEGMNVVEGPAGAGEFAGHPGAALGVARVNEDRAAGDQFGQQLSDLLFDLFEGFPADSSMLARLRVGARRAAGLTWEQGWAREAKDVLLPDAPA